MIITDDVKRPAPAATSPVRRLLLAVIAVGLSALLYLSFTLWEGDQVMQLGSALVILIVAFVIFTDSTPVASPIPGMVKELEQLNRRIDQLERRAAASAAPVRQAPVSKRTVAVRT